MPRRRVWLSARSAPALPSAPDRLAALEPSLAALERFADHGVPLPDGALKHVSTHIAMCVVAGPEVLEHGALLAPALARVWACCARLPASTFAQLPPPTRCAWTKLSGMLQHVTDRLLGGEDESFAPASSLGTVLLRGDALDAFSRQLAAATQTGLGYLQGPRAAGGASAGAAVAAPGQARGLGGGSGAAAATAHASGAAAGGRGAGPGGAAAAAASLLRSGEGGCAQAADTAGAAETAGAANAAAAAAEYASQQAELALTQVRLLLNVATWQEQDEDEDTGEASYCMRLLVTLGNSPVLEHCARAVMLLAAHQAKQEGQGRGGAGGGAPAAAAAPGGPHGRTAAPAAAPAARPVVWSALDRGGCACCGVGESSRGGRNIGGGGRNSSSNAADSAATPQLSTCTVLYLQHVLFRLLGELSEVSVAPAVTGPCVAYAALSFGLVALHLADGGPTPGLDPRLVGVLKEHLHVALANEDGDLDLSYSLATFCGACKVWLFSHRDSASSADARWILRHMLRLVRAVLQQRAEGGMGVLVGPVAVAAAAGGAAGGGGAAAVGAGGDAAAGQAPRRGAGGGRAAAGSSAARGAGSAQHGGTPGRPAEGGAAQHQQPRPVLAPCDSAHLLASALDTALAAWAHSYVRVRDAGGAGGPEQLRLGAELFGAAYRVADSGLMGAAGRGDASKLAVVLASCMGGLPQEGPLPAAPHTRNAAGLAAGLVPWLERCLRRECSKEEADSDLDVAQHLLLMLLHNLAEHGSSLVWPLVYGSPAHVRPLVATLRKLLLRCDQPLVGAVLLRMQAEGTRDCCPVHQDVPEYAVSTVLLVEASRAVLHALRDLAARPLPCDSGVAEGPAAGGAAGGEAQAAGASRCMEQLSYALAQLLPAAASLALQRADWQLSKGAAEAVLPWVDVLWAAEDAVGRQQAQQQQVKPTGGSGAAAAAAEGAVAGAVGGVAGGAAAAAGARSTAAFLRPLLLELGVVRLVGAHLQRVVGEEAASSSGEEGDSEEEEGQGQRQETNDEDSAGPGGVLRACCMVAQLFPQEVRAAAGGAAGVQPAGSGAGSSSSGTGGGGGGGGALGGDPTSADGAPRAGEWRAEWVRELTSRVGAEGRLAVDPAVVRAGEQLASLLEAWAAGHDGAPGAACALPGVSQARLRERHGGVAAQGLLPLAEARSLLRTCSNPQCTSLQGDSDAGLKLQACARCGGPSYCCKGCQVAHWRAGHRDACARP